MREGNIRMAVQMMKCCYAGTGATDPDPCLRQHERIQQQGRQIHGRSATRCTGGEYMSPRRRRQMI